MRQRPAARLMRSAVAAVSRIRDPARCAMNRCAAAGGTWSFPATRW
ncbi:hypothetical protein [Herbidospora yilanensis]|nr:hypothetical protein [Herbidospora yilanensis]